MRIPPYLDYPPVWALGCAVLAAFLDRFVPIISTADFLKPIYGRISIAIALGVLLWSAYWFWKEKTPIEPRHKPKALIVEGPYKISRNPIYSAMALILLGWAIILGSLSGFIPIILFMVIVTKRFILGEEDELRKVFGEKAEEYLKKTRRW